MSSNQQLLDRLYDLSLHHKSMDMEFLHLDALVYRRLEMTYADDEALEAQLAREGVEPATLAAAA